MGKCAPSRRAGREAARFAGGFLSNKGTKEMSVKVIDINQYKLHEGDTGSSDYQVAVLSQRILHLTAHLADHKKDFSSRRGLLRAVAERRRHLDYLKNTAEERYTKLIKGLGLRR